ncbi:hypothetical protein WL61_15165 [Burkholderia ubonensis]|uniref:hypothetical protein n=1 Tax=Burkholderia ubonensis TaxID=101571 RepID=UPI0007583B60|nr:hypothetical protein [Burkholderia ubonensis]KVR19800.1 hypothetical protein WK14_24045 [Burkholderia ubonensis]KWD19918.1 hypothetical protein WL62_19190 [Burkholderia ubonensis]KWD21886.1 hypothetical protein WL61_15165 [Burkholderia ubonensis]
MRKPASLLSDRKQQTLAIGSIRDASSNMAWSPDSYKQAWHRLADVAAQLGDTLIHDLAADMADPHR